MGLTLVTPAADLPVSLAEAKAWCRVDDTASDAIVETLIAAAVGMIEEFTGKALAAQVWLLALDGFADEMVLGVGPVQSVSEVAYVDADGAGQVLDPSIYTLDLVSDPQRIVLNDGETWPETFPVVNAVSITFVAGYAALPAPLRTAALMLVAQWFDTRSAALAGGSANEMPFGVERLIGPYRRIVI